MGATEISGNPCARGEWAEECRLQREERRMLRDLSREREKQGEREGEKRRCMCHEFQYWGGGLFQRFQRDSGTVRHSPPSPYPLTTHLTHSLAHTHTLHSQTICALAHNHTKSYKLSASLRVRHWSGTGIVQRGKGMAKM